MRNMFVVFTIVIFAFQFILSSKHFEYGFSNDDWYVLAWYKQVVQNPILDIAKAWKEIGSHNFARVYYVGILYNFFGLNYPLYHFFNTLLKVLAGLSFFPLLYVLFRKKVFALIAAFVFSIHFSTFGSLNAVFGGKDALIIVIINIFLIIFLRAARKNNFKLKVMFILLILILAAASVDIPRFYPVLFLLPFLEILNYWFHKSLTTIKSAILRLFFLYFPFIIVILYSPHAAISELNMKKFITIFQFGNYQLFISLFASFGSTFIPQGLIDQLSIFSRVGNNALYQDFSTFITFLIFRFLVIAVPTLSILGLLILRKPKWFILRSIFLSISFSIFAFLAANNWLYLDQNIRAAVDPGVYLIPGIIGLFVFSTAISFFIEWLKDRDNYFLLTLSLAPIFSLLYTFFTWILTGDNVIFTGVHGYLTIAAIASSVYLAVIFYLAFRNLKFKSGVKRGIVSVIMTCYFPIFIILSAIQVDNYYADWLKNGYAAADQTRFQDSFWKEVGRGKSNDRSPILVYLDASEDDGYYYGANFAWDIPSIVTVEKSLPFDPGEYCKTVITYKDFDKLRIGMVNGKAMMIQSVCGADRFYKMENFYAFKMVNRNLIPIKQNILDKLEVR